jgi:hypothetical protein
MAFSSVSICDFRFTIAPSLLLCYYLLPDSQGSRENSSSIVRQNRKKPITPKLTQKDRRERERERERETSAEMRKTDVQITL